jgi:hypothetical protein
VGAGHGREKTLLPQEIGCDIVSIGSWNALDVRLQEPFFLEEARMATSTTVITSPRRRKAGTVAMTITFDFDAAILLRELCPPKHRTTGRLLGRLLFEHVARMEERQRMRQRVVSVIEEEKER